jgi:hypothetical protein
MRQHLKGRTSRGGGGEKENMGNSMLVRGVVSDEVGEAGAAGGLHSG